MPRIKGEKKTIKIAPALAPKRQKAKTRSVQKTKLKINFDKCCKTIKENFDLVVSEGMLQITAVEPVQKFLENLADEIKLQIEIIEHRAIIQELRQKSLLSAPKTAKNGGGKAKVRVAGEGASGGSRKAEKKALASSSKKENSKSKKYIIDDEIDSMSNQRGGDEEWMDDATSQTLSSVKGKGKRRTSGASPRAEKENPSLFDESAI